MTEPTSKHFTVHCHRDLSGATMEKCKGCKAGTVFEKTVIVLCGYHGLTTSMG